MCADIYPAVTRQEEPKSGYFRIAAQDGGLLSSFGLSWAAEVEPRLDSEGRLEPKDAQRLISRLEENEHIFELNLAKLPIGEQEHQRGRYALWRKFLESAVINNQPIYTIV
jgi:hypothetical protein